MMKMVMMYKSQTDAELVFAEMAWSQIPETALYGLAGLKVIKSDKLNQASAVILKKFKGSVVSYGPGGCIAYDQTVDYIVNDIQGLHIVE